MRNRPLQKLRPHAGAGFGGCSAPGFWYCCSAASDCCFALLGRFLPKLKAAASSGLFLARKPPGKATPDKSHSAAIFRSGTGRPAQEQGGAVATERVRRLKNFFCLQIDGAQSAGSSVRTVGWRALAGGPRLQVCWHHWLACAHRFFCAERAGERKTAAGERKHCRRRANCRIDRSETPIRRHPQEPFPWTSPSWFSPSPSSSGRPSPIERIADRTGIRRSGERKGRSYRAALFPCRQSVGRRVSRRRWAVPAGHGPMQSIAAFP